MLKITAKEFQHWKKKLHKFSRSHSIWSVHIGWYAWRMLTTYWFYGIFARQKSSKCRILPQ